MNIIPKEIIQHRMDERIALNRGKAEGSIIELLRQHQDTTNLLVSSRHHLMLGTEHVEDSSVIHPVISITDVNSGVGTTNRLHDNAINQLAGRFNIPVKYFREQLRSNEEWRVELGRTIANEHLENMPEKNLLIRSVNGETRAILSDAYRPMDAAPIFSAFGNIAKEQGGILWSGACGELRSYLEVVHPTIHEIQTPNNGTVFMAFGGSISSSDFGQGSLDIRFFSVQGVCANGMIGQSIRKNVHLGKRLDQENFRYSKETNDADTRTLILATRDLALNLMSPESVQAQIDTIMGASAKLITNMERTIKELPKTGLLQEEIEEVNCLLLTSNPYDGIQGALSQWKLQQAVTAMARNLEPIRSREVQVIAGQLS